MSLDEPTPRRGRSRATKYASLATAGSIAALIVCVAASSGLSSDRVVRAYDGSWRTHFIEVQSPYTSASDRRGTISNACSVDGLDAVCAQTVNGALADTVRYHPTAGGTSFATTTSTPGGAAPATGELVISGKEWAYPWTVRSGSLSVMFKVVNKFIGRDRIEYFKFFSVDAGRHWQKVGSGEEVRIRAAS